MSRRLPQPDALRVEARKLVDYLLSETHPDGQSKARFFASLGFNASEWDVLATSLQQHGREQDVIEEIETPFGIKYIVQCALHTPNARNPCIRSVWITELGNTPRLVTAYPNSA